ncbi:Os03g0849500 [Oryza sativa Japonica Group]|uniref:Os03g0849500 protein n=1 Tax=Oryza sativa subsp. japonica TaxID=39947 RepID=A0A0P0W5F4_ORYSJ|nr:Os03g0849500 [Oryza sativa Japonica Group]
MAELMATMVVGPLVSMVKEKASSYLMEQYKVMEGMEEQHKILKRKLPAILDVIADAEEQAAKHREGAKAWLEELRKVAYQANDVFDEFKYEALRRKAKANWQYKMLGMDVIKLFPTHNRIVFRYRMGNKLRMILNAIEKNCNERAEFKEVVNGQRFLLVLDDVWNREASKWEALKSYVQHGGSGSSVLTTTRDKTVAEIMAPPKEVHHLKDLNENFIKEIIERSAFNSEEEKRQSELLEMVGDIAKKCSGSPLAATALGSTLRTKTTKKEWEAILRRSTICDEENGILPILKLSYNCLPSYMRQCFAFCAIFPKDHVIDVEMLIQLWMANCFIPEQQGECPEISGKRIFSELVSRSFFQDVKGIPFEFHDIKDSKITAKIHDLMHDVAQSSMGKECAAIDSESIGSEDFPYSARHLFLSGDRPEVILNSSLEKGYPGIQTLIYSSQNEDLQNLSKYRSLRALEIWGGIILKPKYHHHLRYLDLSCSEIKALPEDISILYHLQTLNLSHCSNLHRLPKGTKYMTALRHLYTHGCERLKSMPPNLGHLTCLQTLTCFVAGACSGCSDLGELRQSDLGGRLELTQLENVTKADAKAANLGKKKKLTELSLGWADQEYKEAQR